MTDVFIPPYTEYSDALMIAQSDFQPAEIHGLFTGYLCGTKKEKFDWQKIILPASKDTPCQAMLQQLYDITAQQLTEFSLDFNLLLPDDDTDINARAEALGLWCQGFLTGLKHADIPLRNHKNPEVAESIQDLTEIAKVDNGNIVENEEDETAYFELVEYVRLAALLIFHEENSKSSPSSSEDHRH